jgi:hypothetical protein
LGFAREYPDHPGKGLGPGAIARLQNIDTLADRELA